MTPLALRITKELTLPKKRRTFNDHDGMLQHMSDVHCFDLSDVVDLVDVISADILERLTVDERTSFLPAPRTWIEFSLRSGGLKVQGQLGWLLEETKNPFSARVFSALGDKIDKFGGRAVGEMRLGQFIQPNYNDDIVPDSYSRILAALAIINTPRIIGRKQHTPHRGLERRLIAHRSVLGKFPLHAWTEIKLNVTAPKDLSDNASVEAHYTGERALHFCRAHLRVRRGRLEIVRSHWRGDGSLGIKQSRYKLTSASGGARA